MSYPQVIKHRVWRVCTNSRSVCTARQSRGDPSGWAACSPVPQRRLRLMPACAAGATKWKGVYIDHAAHLHLHFRMHASSIPPVAARANSPAQPNSHSPPAPSSKSPDNLQTFPLPSPRIPHPPKQFARPSTRHTPATTDDAPGREHAALFAHACLRFHNAIRPLFTSSPT